MLAMLVVILVVMRSICSANMLWSPNADANAYATSRITFYSRSTVSGSHHDLIWEYLRFADILFLGLCL